MPDKERTKQRRFETAREEARAQLAILDQKVKDRELVQRLRAHSDSDLVPTIVKDGALALARILELLVEVEDDIARQNS